MENADAKIVKAVTRIKAGKYPQEGLGMAARLAGLLSQRLWFGHRTGNILMKEHTAVGMDKCTVCYRCVNACPKQAITLLGKSVIEQTSIEKYL